MTNVNPDQNSELHSQVEALAPVSNGRFAMWLFLSTEVMFFAGLFAACLVLASSLAPGLWPQNKWVHVSLPIGFANTVVLTLSSMTAWLALRSARRKEYGQVQIRLAVTILLGIVFLGVKGFEYKTKIELGIIPKSARRQVHDQPDIYYLAAVRNDLDARIMELERRKSVQRNASNASAGSNIDQGLQEYYTIRSGLVAWTESRVANTNDQAEQQESLNAFAAHVYRIDSEPLFDLKAFVTRERTAIDASLNELTANYDRLTNEINVGNQNINELESQRRQLEQLPDAESDENREQLKQVTLQISEAKKNVGEKTQTASILRQKIVPQQNRLEFLDQGAVDEGINHAESRPGFPLVIPGGGTWMNIYYLLTVTHAIHVLAGLLVLVLFLLPGLTSNCSALHNAILYWHFVDVVWLIIFAVIYL